MHITHTCIAGVLVIEPCAFTDHRGFFVETWNRQRFQASGIDADFVQDNHSQSTQGVLRGLHYQVDRPQGKLVWAVRGEVYDVIVDLRRESATFGKWTSVILSSQNHRQVYLPPKMAHGYCVLSPEADVAYKSTEFYFPPLERTILWNDPQLAIEWPISSPILSEKDHHGILFRDAPHYS